MNPLKLIVKLGDISSDCCNKVPEHKEDSEEHTKPKPKPKKKKHISKDKE